MQLWRKWYLIFSGCTSSSKPGCTQKNKICVSWMHLQMFCWSVWHFDSKVACGIEREKNLCQHILLSSSISGTDYELQEQWRPGQFLASNDSSVWQVDVMLPEAERQSTYQPLQRGVEGEGKCFLEHRSTPFPTEEGEGRRGGSPLCSICWVDKLDGTWGLQGSFPI